MATTLEEKTTTPKDSGEKRYRIMAKTPEEALKVIRKKFGDKAKVQSVKQVDGQGLAKFLSSPKLEIILSVPADDPQAKATLETVDKEGVRVEEHEEKPAEDTRGAISSSPSPPPEMPQPNFTASIKDDSMANSTAGISEDASIHGLLKRSGFDEGLLAAILDSPELEGLEALPIPHALAEISHWLKKRYEGVKPRSTTNRVAFLGTPGTGKTTALCKILAHSTFFENKTAHVFKVDQEIPNPDDALRIFCESLSINLYRDKGMLFSLPPSELLYIDTPGIPLNDAVGWSTLGQNLDELEISSRILVLNASYDSQMLKATLERSASCRPTHLIFTHLDELHNCTKLWPFVFSKEVSTLMLCHGQNITSDYTRDNLCKFLLASSFPRQVLQSG